MRHLRSVAILGSHSLTASALVNSLKTLSSIDHLYLSEPLYEILDAPLEKISPISPQAHLFPREANLDALFYLGAELQLIPAPSSLPPKLPEIIPWVTYARENTIPFLYSCEEEVFGEPLGLEAHSESSPFQPLTPEAALESGICLYLEAIRDTFQQEIFLAFSSSLYGQGLPDSHLLSQMKESSSIPLPNEGRQLRNWLHADDYAQGLLSVHQKGSRKRRYFFASKDDKTLLGIWRQVTSIMDLPEPSFSQSSTQTFHHIPNQYRLSTEQAELYFGWESTRDLSEELPGLIAGLGSSPHIQVASQKTTLPPRRTEGCSPKYQQFEESPLD